MATISITKETMKKEVIRFVNEDELCKTEPLAALMTTVNLLSFIDYLFKECDEDENNGKMP